MKKFAGIRKVLDGINQLNGPTSTSQTDGQPTLNDSLQAEDFALAKVGRYGFPFRATCLALDPIQKLLAIGTDNGAIRICGKPGVEFHVQHECKQNEKAVVTLLQFLINEGGLVSVVCKMNNSELVDSSLHIWSIRQKQPALIQSLNFKNQKITAIHSQMGCKWLYVGTERGNVFMVNVESFHISGYVIYWNNALDVSRKTHPGPVISIQTNPVDSNKLLINFDSDVCILWDLRTKKMQCQYMPSEVTKYSTCVKWHSEGKQFMAGNYDGSLSTWNFKNNKKVDEHQLPHGSAKSNSKDATPCCPITKLEWHTGEAPLVIFSGGMPYGNHNKGLTIMRGRSKSLILSDYVVDFECLYTTLPTSEFLIPQALFVLLKNEIVVFDLSGSIGPNLPWFSLPYTFNIHESPVTCLQFYPECPNDLLTALHGLASAQHHEPSNRSKQPWPLFGGSEGDVNQEPAIIITGHADGTVKFWDATSNMLISCAKLSISRLFDRQMSRQSSTTSNLSKASSIEQFDDPFAIQHITMCPYGRVLTVVCQSYFLVVFKFKSKENSYETPSVDVNFVVEVASECNESPTSLNDPLNNSFNDITSLRKTSSSHRLSNASLFLPHHPPLRTTGVKWPVGFQPEIVCQQVAYEPMPNISSVAVSSAYGLVCFGNSMGLAIVDYLQKCTVTVIMSYELGVAGEWSDSTANKTPLSPTKSNPSTPTTDLPNGSTEGGKRDRFEKRKDRVSRMLTISDHQKLSKKNSFKMRNGDGSGGGIGGGGHQVHQDQEDGYIRDKRDEPTAGHIQSLTFAYSYTRKSGNLVCPALWVGTSVGDVAVLALGMPSSGSQRLIQPVLALNTGMHLNCSHSILNITQLDKSGNICGSPFEFWRDRNSPNPDADRSNIQLISTESTAKQFLCITTEKQIRMKSIPSFKRYASVDPVLANDPNGAFIVKASAMSVNGGSCIGCLTTSGSLKIYSLPSLRLLLDVECGLVDYRVIRTFTIGKGGECVFLSSPTEIQRIALTKQKEEAFLDEHGCLFTLCQSPQQKPKGFFESFFNSTPSSLDRDELFGPKSGAVSRNVAEHIPGSGMTSLRNSADGVAGAALHARQQLFERGEKLGILSDRAEEMNEKAKSFASASQALAEKYKNKKWYQL